MNDPNTTSRIFKLVCDFLEQKRPELLSHSAGLTDVQVANTVASVKLLSAQSSRWPNKFAEMDAAYQDAAIALFKKQSGNIRPVQNIGSDFIPKMFEGIKRSHEVEYPDQDFATGYGHGAAAFVYALLVIALLFAAQEAAERSGIDNRPVLDAVAAFMGDLKFKPFTAHAAKLAHAISTELPDRLRDI